MPINETVHPIVAVDRGERWVPWLPAIVALAGLAVVGDGAAWVGLTVAGLGMGMILFMATAGLNLVLGVMGVMNFGHGIFLALGGYAGAVAFIVASRWMAVAVPFTHPLLTVVALLYAMICVMLVSLPVGWIFERLVIRPAGSDTTRQIMLTAAGALVFSELAIALIGRGTYLPPLAGLTGSWLIGTVAFEKLRVLIIVIGLLAWGGLMLILDRTLLGVLIRATVENRELVEASGYRTRGLTNLVFVLGCGLAGIGGLVWAMYQQRIGIDEGRTLFPLLLMTLMIGGLHSLTGTLVAAVMLGLVTNYVGYASPVLTSFSCVALTLVVLVCRPHGLYRRHSARLGSGRLFGTEALSNPVVDRLIAVIAALPYAYLVWVYLQYWPLPLESILVVVNLGTITITMLLRHPPKRVTHNPLFWFLAFLVSYWQFFMLRLYQPGVRFAPELVTEGLAILGILVTLWARFSLGRNIGLVPAERRIVCDGPYRYVRHPIYSGIFLTLVGMTLANLTLRNAMINLVWIALFAYKAIIEERFLSQTEEYATYLRRVRWRWLPWIA